MVKIEVGLQISETDYRNLPYPSYSLLSNLRKHGADAMYGKKEDISDLDGIIIGSIADSLVTEFKDPANLVLIDKKPAAKALNVIKQLSNRMDLVDSNNIVSAKNHVMINQACLKEDYYAKKTGKEQAKAIRKYGKYANAINKYGNSALIASNYQYQIAKDIASMIFSKYGFVKHKENIVGQVKLVGNVNGVDIKGMLDFIYISHKRKTVVPFDLKTGYGTYFNFFTNGYLGWNYYIQASLYRELLIQALSTHPILKDYAVDNFRFMYCGREDKLPVIFKVTDKQHEAGLHGFYFQQERYEGVHELIKHYEHYRAKPNNRYRFGYDASEISMDDSYL